MTSVDTNILLYAQNADCPEHQAAWDFLTAERTSRNVAVCELVLIELYILAASHADASSTFGWL